MDLHLRPGGFFKETKWKQRQQNQAEDHVIEAYPSLVVNLSSNCYFITYCY